MLNYQTSIKTEKGERVDALAPVIISASRSTDISAFYAEWFFNRLEAGYCAWHNPFNRKKTYISFEKCRAVVFWTKNPAPIIPYLSRLDKRGIHYYFQVTLNDYENEGLEPNIPSLGERIKTFQKLATLLGPERVIWRFDPLLVAPPLLTPRDLLTKIWKIGKPLKGYTEKMVFSFIDVGVYKKVQNNLLRETSLFSKETVLDAEMNASQRQEILEGLKKIREAWQKDGWNISFASCGEDVDLRAYGIERNRCIDGELMQRVFAEDKPFVNWLRFGTFEEKQPTLFTLPALKPEKMKDKGQRKACGCMVSKDIGSYNTCGHGCVYCYANTSSARAMENAKRHDPLSESIIG